MREIVNKESLCIHETIVEIDNPQIFQWEQVFQSILKQIGTSHNIIKCNLVKSTKSKLFFQTIYLDGIKGFINEPFTVPSPKQQVLNTSTNDISCLIIPTGIGAKYGGYAGDANPLAKLLAAQSKYLLTHPNVVNGAVLSDIPNNLIYLEGFLLDQFLLGLVSLTPKRNNKIGVIFDKGIPEDRLEYEINVLNATRAFYGCDIDSWTVTDKPLFISPRIDSFGFSSGEIKGLEYLIEKALKLKERGVTAIAICCAIPDIEANKDYILGSGIDPIGGIEAIISRTVSFCTGLASAHAPVLISNEKIDYKKISPVSASEYIAKTFLSSVISGLRFAPRIQDKRQEAGGRRQEAGGNDRDVACNVSTEVTNNNLNEVIVPYNAFGSPGVFYLNEVYKNIVLIKENHTSLEVSPEHLNMKFNIVNSYKELVNSSSFNEAGIDSNVLTRPLHKIKNV